MGYPEHMGVLPRDLGGDERESVLDSASTEVTIEPTGRREYSGASGHSRNNTECHLGCGRWFGCGHVDTGANTPWL